MTFKENIKQILRMDYFRSLLKPYILNKRTGRAVLAEAKRITKKQIPYVLGELKTNVVKVLDVYKRRKVKSQIREEAMNKKEDGMEKPYEEEVNIDVKEYISKMVKVARFVKEEEERNHEDEEGKKNEEEEEKEEEEKKIEKGKKNCEKEKKNVDEKKNEEVKEKNKLQQEIASADKKVEDDKNKEGEKNIFK